MGAGGTGRINRGKHLPIIEKTVKRTAVKIVPHDLPIIVDFSKSRMNSSKKRNINCGEHPFLIEEAVNPILPCEISILINGPIY